VADLVATSRALGVSLEFSANTEYEPDIVRHLKKINGPFLIHNYFPRPKKDFTINLASENTRIRKESIAHCINAVKLCTLFRLPFYSVHAGFRLDVPPVHLGKQFPEIELLSYEDAYEFFLDSIRKILKETSSSPCKILIENNVITQQNMKGMENPLLMCHFVEMERLLTDLGDNQFGFLVDFGHLNVSSRTLGFSKECFLDALDDHMFCFHVHENNAEMDQHKAFGGDAWFLPYLHKHPEIPIVIETDNNPHENIISMIALLERNAG
jgi:sugar phosphate isomerase/epimerase